jgi:hypothetical protein
VITLPNAEEIRSARSRSPQHLGRRLEYQRACRFVGRDAELELFAAPAGGDSNLARRGRPGTRDINSTARFN